MIYKVIQYHTRTGEKTHGKYTSLLEAQKKFTMISIDILGDKFKPQYFHNVLSVGDLHYPAGYVTIVEENNSIVDNAIIDVEIVSDKITLTHNADEIIALIEDKQPQQIQLLLS